MTGRGSRTGPGRARPRRAAASADGAGEPRSIASVRDLRAHLQVAMQLEHATIPPYFTAWLSIHEGSNREAGEVIRSVMLEEMLHLTLAANLLNAVGGRPRLTQKGFVARYPTRLPHSGDRFEVSIERFSKSALETFLRIERPEARGAKPQPGHYRTIGQFYAAIDAGLDALCDRLGEARVFTGDRARQVQPEHYYGSGSLIVVTGRDSAHRAIREIVEQGEGAHHSIFDEDHKILGEGGGRELAHYYRFRQLLYGRHYARHDTPARPPTGTSLPVDFGAVYPIRANERRSRYRRGTDVRKALDAFAAGYTRLLAALETAFDGKPDSITEAMARMFSIKAQALALMRMPSGRGDGSTVGLDFEPPTRRQAASRAARRTGGPRARPSATAAAGVGRSR